MSVKLKTPTSNIASATFSSETLENIVLSAGSTVVVSAYTAPIALYAAKSHVIGTKVYIVGGLNNNVASYLIYVFDTVTSEWSVKLGRNLVGSVSEVIDGLIHFVGGADTPQQHISWNPETEEWLTYNSLDSVYIISKWSSSCMCDGKMYIAHGSVSYIASWDSSTDTWTSLASVPWILRNTVMFTYNNRIYVAGGHNTFLRKYIHIFNTSTNTWSNDSTGITTARDGHMLVITADGSIYLMGGRITDAGGLTTSIEKFNTSTLKFKIVSELTLSEGRSRMIVFPVGNDIHILSGSTAMNLAYGNSERPPSGTASTVYDVISPINSTNMKIKYTVDGKDVLDASGNVTLDALTYQEPITINLPNIIRAVTVYE